ncbi:hypothetical protein D3C86_2056340 [compost metagenome]
MFQCPSIAAILAGWCLSVFRPWASPTTAWIGAAISTIHSAIDSILRAAGTARSCSSCQAEDAATNSAVDSSAAITMCARR